MDNMKQMTDIINHDNFYLIELQNEALSSVFSNSYNLKYFVVLSNEFSDDLTTAVTCETAINEIISQISPTYIDKKFSPIIFPTLNEDHLMQSIDDEKYKDAVVYDSMHPSTIIRTIAKRNDDLLFSARVISNSAFDNPQQKEKIILQ